jgi:hypothetical protein
MYLFFPQSTQLDRIVSVADQLVAMKVVQPNFFRNFDLELGGYFTERSEILFAFLYSVFRHFSGICPVKPIESVPDDDDELQSIGPVEQEEPGRQEVERIAAVEVFDKLCRGAPVSFGMVAARKMGNLWMGRDFQTFTEIMYVARLLDKMTEVIDRKDGPRRQRCSPKRLMAALLDFSSTKNKSLLRNKVCENVLTK